ncbi:hypothetical protein HNR61_004524 [Actinomadura namibiensis]|uniref:Uncharacterized protein n=1 Tax=Actinomadura namibiensis TaxID=182080 RepID=A0A7W3LRB4_ACTNM|nr:hypothetical protein [Actinomadura namibiensis]
MITQERDSNESAPGASTASSSEAPAAGAP